MTDSSDKIKKVSIIISKGSLDGVYPGLIMANGARMEGIEASIFFTFFGLYAILSKYMGHIGIATVGNPVMRVPHAKGFPLPTILGVLPGMSAFATAMMNKEMEKLDIPPFHLGPADFCPQVDKVLTVGEFYALSAGAQIIFT
jgi:peroxiredoxin family protein